jgi:V/A-type H+-transporting ATPase subunit C
VARLDFANARIGARRARLGGLAVLRELLARPTLEARIELLRAFPVGRAIPPPAGPDPIGEAERGLRHAIREDALAILAEAEGSRARAVLAAFLALDEAEAVKVVLRGVSRAAPIDATMSSVPPFPGIAEEALRAAAAASNAAAAADVLAAAGSAVAAAVRRELTPGVAPELARLEIAADRCAQARARAACRRRGEDGEVLSAHLADLADARNAKTLLLVAGAPRPAPAAGAGPAHRRAEVRARHREGDGEARTAGQEPGAAPWLAGGRRWDEAILDRLARAGHGDARAAVAEEFPGAGAALPRPWAVDRALAASIVLRLRREARLRPLSIAVPLAYLAARREEARAVALVLRGASVELPGDEILDLVEA